MTENQIGNIIVGAAIRVHRKTGPGLLESTYQACLEYELKKSGLFTDKEAALPVIYDDVKLDCGYRIDLWLERKVIVEVKISSCIERRSHGSNINIPETLR